MLSSTMVFFYNPFLVFTNDNVLIEVAKAPNVGIRNKSREMNDSLKVIKLSLKEARVSHPVLGAKLNA